MSENFTAWEKFDTGMIPGTIGAVIPAARHRSRKRRYVEVSKKYWVIARVAPASSFRFRFSRSAIGLEAAGCTSGYAATEISKSATFFKPATRSAANG